MSQQNQHQLAQIVYCVVRYGQVVGCYSDFDEATQVAKLSIAKGQVCDVIVKPLIYPQNGQTK